MTDAYCEHCGASLREWWHKITPGLVNVLVKFKSAVIFHNRNKIHIPKEVEMTKSEYNNFQKLRYHALVAKWKNDDGLHESGYWLLTRRGSQFLKGEIAIPRSVKTFRNKVQEHSDDLVYVKDVIGTIPYFEEKNDFEFEVREEPVNHYEFNPSGQGILL